MPFASLYGCQSREDDLADFLAFYHLTQKMRLPYRICVRHNFDRKTLFEWEPMASPAVKQRFAALAVFYREDAP